MSSPLLRVMQRVNLHYYVILTHYCVIITRGPIIIHCNIFQSSELADVRPTKTCPWRMPHATLHNGQWKCVLSNARLQGTVPIHGQRAQHQQFRILHASVDRHESIANERWLETGQHAASLTSVTIHKTGRRVNLNPQSPLPL